MASRRRRVRALGAAGHRRRRGLRFAGRVDPIANTQSGVVAVKAASGSERWRYDTEFAPSHLGAWDVAVAEGLVVVPGSRPSSGLVSA